MSDIRETTNALLKIIDTDPILKDALGENFHKLTTLLKAQQFDYDAIVEKTSSLLNRFNDAAHGIQLLESNTKATVHGLFQHLGEELLQQCQGKATPQALGLLCNAIIRIREPSPRPNQTMHTISLSLIRSELGRSELGRSGASQRR